MNVIFPIRPLVIAAVCGAFSISANAAFSNNSVLSTTNPRYDFYYYYERPSFDDIQTPFSNWNSFSLVESAHLYIGLADNDRDNRAYFKGADLYQLTPNSSNPNAPQLQLITHMPVDPPPPWPFASYITHTTVQLAPGNYMVNVYGDRGYNGTFYTGQVSITAVPEPENYVLMIAGLGVVGFMSRRRHQNPLPAPC